MKTGIFVISITCLLFCASCFSGFRLKKGNGNVVIRNFQVEAFNQIELGGNYKVELFESTQAGVEIKTDENLFEYINVEDYGNSLYINNIKNLQPTDEIIVNIFFEELERVSVTGVASINAYEPLNQDEFEINLAGAGSVKLDMEVEHLDVTLSGAGAMNLSGEAESAKITMSGAGGLNAKDLKIDYCEISVGGIGGAKIHVDKQLKASISGIGGIEYLGNPNKIEKSVSGLGKIYPSDEPEFIEENDENI